MSKYYMVYGIGIWFVLEICILPLNIFCKFIHTFFLKNSLPTNFIMTGSILIFFLYIWLYKVKNMYIPYY